MKVIKLQFFRNLVLLDIQYEALIKSNVFILSVEVVQCLELTLENGTVTYATDTMANFELGTVATHSCEIGFVLLGAVTRICMDDDGMDNIGVWSGSTPTCAGRYILNYAFVNYLPCDLFSGKIQRNYMILDSRET